MLMMGAYSISKGFKEQNIGNIDYVRSNQNLADGFTKSMNQVSHRSVVTSGKLHI